MVRYKVVKELCLTRSSCGGFTAYPAPGCNAQGGERGKRPKEAEEVNAVKSESHAVKQHETLANGKFYVQLVYEEPGRASREIRGDDPDRDRC